MATEAVFYMPSRSSPSAPKFDGTTRNLFWYFREYEDLAEKAKLSNLKKKSDITRYLEYSDERFWESISEYSNDQSTYEQYKAAIVLAYPGSLDEAPM